MLDLTAQLNAKLAEIQAQADEKKDAARLHFSILESLPETAAYAPPSVHVQGLWTTEVLVAYRIQYYASIAKGQSPDADLLEQLVTALPPEPMVLVSDGCKSFRPAAGEWSGETTPIHPFILRVRQGSSPAITVNWVTRLPNGKLARFEVDMPLRGCKLGTAFFVRGLGQPGREGPVEQCDFRMAPQTPGRPTPRKIKWSTGGNRYELNEITLYWPEGDGPVDLPGLWRQ